MGGSVKFEDALQMRLAVMNSSHQNIQDFLAAHPPRISKGDLQISPFVAKPWLIPIAPFSPQDHCPGSVTKVEVLLVHAGIAELVQELQQRQTAVYLVSGGFRAVINPIAEILKIPLENVYANTILYDVSLAITHS